MLARITLKLGLGEKETAHPSMAVLLHGVLMRLVSPGAAAELHRQGLKPFSQYIVPGEPGQALWVVNVLHSSAQEIYRVLSDERLKEIYLEQKGKSYPVLDRRAEVSPGYREMAEEHYLTRPLERRWRITFVTPAAFKSEGGYCILPAPRLIYQNLINRWNQFAPGLSLDGENLCDQLTAHTAVKSYSLRSRPFHLEGVAVPSFGGWLELALGGPEALARLGVLLLHYACWAGVGIKTAMGMGGTEIGARAAGPAGRLRPGAL